MTPLRIIGAGGHGRVVAEIAEACGYTDIAFVDQSWPTQTTNGPWAVVGEQPSKTDLIFCAIGNNATRARICDTTNDMPTIIHPTAIISPTASLSAGTVAMPGVIVNAQTEIGQGAILNTACTIDHDCKIGNFVHISPGAHLAGNVHVGQETWIGIGAVVREGVRIGSNVIVAAGAAVVRDIPDHSRVGGVPARDI